MKKFALYLFCFFELAGLISQSAIAKDSTSFDPNYVAISANESTVPVGTIAIWSTSSALPDAWLECDGSTISSEYPDLIALVGSTSPNYQGMFLRGYGSQSYSQTNGSRYGTTSTSHSSGSLGEVQGDAIREIWGTIYVDNNTGASGTFASSGTTVSPGIMTDSSSSVPIYFKSSYIVPTSTENRPVNTAVRYIIKAD